MAAMKTSAAIAVLVLMFGAASQAQGPPPLRIVVIEGEDAVNVIQQKTAVAPLVEVRDRNDQPVAGAIVTFSVRGTNLASFGGSQTLTVTTNAAGRAAAAAFNPVSSGAVQIQVQAAFQGQTAVAAIAQTNVMTAAEAAAAAASAPGGAGAGSAGGAAGGSGGGLSGTTIGIIGAAAAGGAVAATQLGGESSSNSNSQTPAATTYSGPYGMTFVMTVTNNDGSNPCTHVTGYNGTLRMTVNDQGGVVTGNATMEGTKAAVGPTTCGGQPVNGVFFSGSESDLPITGNPGAVTFRRERTGVTENNIAVSETVSFNGAIGGNTITGTLTVARREANATRIGTGTGTQQVTLTRQ